MIACEAASEVGLPVDDESAVFPFRCNSFLQNHARKGSATERTSSSLRTAPVVPDCNAEPVNGAVGYTDRWTRPGLSDVSARIATNAIRSRSMG